MNEQQRIDASTALAMSWAKAYQPLLTDAEAAAIASERQRDELYRDWREFQQDRADHDAHQTRSKYRALGVAGFVVSCLLGIGLALFLLTFRARS